MAHDLSQKFRENSVFTVRSNTELVFTFEKVISEIILPHSTSVLTQTLAKSIRLTHRAVVRFSNLWRRILIDYGNPKASKMLD